MPIQPIEQQFQFITDYFENKSYLATDGDYLTTPIFTKGITPTPELKILFLKIHLFVLTNKEVLPKDKLNHLATLIDRRVVSLQANTKGLLALFLLLFNWWRSSNLRAEAEALKPLGGKIREVMNDLPIRQNTPNTTNRPTENLTAPSTPLPPPPPPTDPITPIKPKKKTVGFTEDNSNNIELLPLQLGDEPHTPAGPPPPPQPPNVKFLQTPAKQIPIQLYALENEPTEPTFNAIKYLQLPNENIVEQNEQIRTHLNEMDQCLDPLRVSVNKVKDNTDRINEKRLDIEDNQRELDSLEIKMGKIMQLNNEIAILDPNHTVEDEPEKGILIFPINPNTQAKKIVFFSDKAFDHWKTKLESTNPNKMTIPNILRWDEVLRVFEERYEELSEDQESLKEELIELQRENDTIMRSTNNAIPFSQFEKVLETKEATRNRWARSLKSRENYLAGKNKSQQAQRATGDTEERPIPIQILKDLQSEVKTAIVFKGQSGGKEIVQLFRYRTKT